MDAGDEPAIYKLSHEPRSPIVTNLTVDLPDQLEVPAGGSAPLAIEFGTDNLVAGLYDGRILLQSDTHAIRLTYTIRILPERKDVLLINSLSSRISAEGQTTYEDTTDYSPFWTDALDVAELSYDVWTIQGSIAQGGAPPLSTLQQYDLVIVAGGDSNVPIEAGPNAMTSIQMYLLGGGAALISGKHWPHAYRAWAGPQAAGSPHMLSRYFAGFHATEDDADPELSLISHNLFEDIVSISNGTDADAANNAISMDFGEPFSEIDSRPREGDEPPAPDYSWAHGVGELLMPYVHSYLETLDGRSAMTGVTPDASLEVPEVSKAVSWRALYAGFPIEAVTSAGGASLSRADMLQQIFQWATEPEDTLIRIKAPRAVKPGQEFSIQASFDAHEEFSGQASWRWDLGDGSNFIETDAPQTTHRYEEAGEYTLRAELTSKAGRTFVAQTTITVSRNAGDIYLPMLLRKSEVVAP